VTIGQREIETHGLGTGFWSDLYHRSMIVRWPGFFGTAALIFIILNAGVRIAVLAGRPADRQCRR